MPQDNSKPLAHWNASDLPYSNEPPSEADAARAYITLDALQPELRRVEVELALLLAKRARLKRQIIRYKTVVAPYKKLPAELIGEIISACAATSGLKDLPVYEEGDPRLVMTQVCSSWRRAAFDIPNLWNATFAVCDPPRESVHLTSSWFSQCSGSALSLKTSRTRMTWGPEGPLRVLSVFTGLVVPYSRRIATLDLHLGVAQWDMIRSLPFDNLVTLYLPFDLVSGTDHPGELVCAPSLRSVHINGLIGNDELPGLPWAQLTNVSLIGCFPLPQFIVRCTSLQKLVLCHVAMPSARFLEMPIHLPCLESLSISFAFDTPEMLGLLSLFRAPCLSFFKLGRLPTDDEAIAKVIKFIFSIADTLRHFEVMFGSHAFVREEHISPMSSVTHFIIPDWYSFPFDTLSLIGTGDLLPNLEHLGLHVSQCEVDIVDMLVARHAYNVRIAPRPGLKMVDIVAHDVRWGDVELSGLQMLRSQGMDVNIVDA